MIDVDVRELIAHPGSSRHHRLRQPVAGLRVELAAVPDDAPVEGDLLLESVVEGILVSGPLTGPLLLTCARCLQEFAGRVDVGLVGSGKGVLIAEGTQVPLQWSRASVRAVTQFTRADGAPPG